MASWLEKIRGRNLQAWTAGYGRWLAASAVPRARAALRPGQVRRAERVRAWLHGYPTMAGPFRDSEGRPPRHSFFFPGEEYEPGYLDALAGLARRGLGEVELHLHHDGDTAESLR